MSIYKLKMMAGVPINKDDIVTESSSSQSGVGRAVNRYIKVLDHKMGISKNREDITTYSKLASDFEDVLLMVRAGKKSKAVKMFNEISDSHKNKFYETLKSNQAKVVKSYFSSLTEGCEEDEEVSKFAIDNEESIDPEANTAPEVDVELEPKDDAKEEPKSEDDVIECPYCDYHCGKIDFYDHIIKSHIGSDSEEEPAGTDVEPESTGIPSNDMQKSLVSNMGTIAMTFEDNKVSEAEDATVWGKTDDKDESPSPYPEEPKDDSTIKCPKNIKDTLTKEISELQKQAEALVNTDYNTSDFYTNVANAMTEVLSYLTMESEYGMKMAQVCLVKYMSPIVQKFPAEVYDFILRGGQVESITALFKKSKGSNNVTV